MIDVSPVKEFRGRVQLVAQHDRFDIEQVHERKLIEENKRGGPDDSPEKDRTSKFAQDHHRQVDEIAPTPFSYGDFGSVQFHVRLLFIGLG